MNSLDTQNNRKIFEKVKWLCGDSYITIDNKVFSLSFKEKKEVLKGGSYCFYICGDYRTKKWIRENCINIDGIKDF